MARPGTVRTKSLVVDIPGRMVMWEFPVPTIGPMDLLLRVEMVGICGGEPKKYVGTSAWAAADESPYPLILGHEVVGFVHEVGEVAAQAYGVAVGDRVTVEPYIPCHFCPFCERGVYQLCRRRRVFGTTISCSVAPHLWGAYGEFLYVPFGARLHRIGPQVSARAAHLSSVLGNGFRWVRTKGRLQSLQAIVILGAGAQGLASTIAAVESGGRPIIVVGLRRDERRLALARELGAHHTLVAGEEDIVARVRELTDGDMAHVAVECSGSPEATRLGLDLLRPLGRYVVPGLPGGGKEIPIPFDKIVLKELQILGGLGQSIEVADAVRLINSGRYPIERIVTHVMPLERGEEAMKLFMSGDPACIRVALTPPGSSSR